MLSLTVCSLVASALTAQEMSPGSAIVTSRQGDVFVTDEAGKRFPIQLQEAISPPNTVWTTKNDAHAFLSFSNGVAVGIDANTRLTCIDYLQRPFGENNQGFDYEPSVSNLQLRLESGQIAVASNRLSPLSELRIELPIGSLRVHKGTCLIRYDSTGLTLMSVDGNLTYRFPDQESREFVTAGKQVRISEMGAERQQVAERNENPSITEGNQRMIDATIHSSRRVFYQANEGTGQPPQAVIVVRPEYFKQPSLRPYQFQD